MLTVKKRSGKQADFDKKKLEKSIRNAGADENTARSIAEGTKHREGLTTPEIRKHVVAELQRHHADVGKHYESFKKPATKK